MENLRVGTVGWQHKDWLDGFYPEGMPEDWQLDFYSNIYSAVLVPQTDWVQWQEDELEEIQEALEGEDFAMYFAFKCDQGKGFPQKKY